jgi:hypothetical protein
MDLERRVRVNPFGRFVSHFSILTLGRGFPIATSPARDREGYAEEETDHDPPG